MSVSVPSCLATKRIFEVVFPFFLFFPKSDSNLDFQTLKRSICLERITKPVKSNICCWRKLSRIVSGNMSMIGG